MKHIVKRSDFMYGAILGDIIGSPYEFDQGGKTKDPKIPPSPMTAS